MCIANIKRAWLRRTVLVCYTPVILAALLFAVVYCALCDLLDSLDGIEEVLRTGWNGK